MFSHFNPPRQQLHIIHSNLIELSSFGYSQNYTHTHTQISVHTHSQLLTKQVPSLLTLTEKLGGWSPLQRGLGVQPWASQVTVLSSESFWFRRGARAQREVTLSLAWETPNKDTDTLKLASSGSSADQANAGDFSDRRGSPGRRRMLRALPMWGAQESIWSGEKQPERPVGGTSQLCPSPGVPHPSSNSPSDNWTQRRPCWSGSFTSRNRSAVSNWNLFLNTSSKLPHCSLPTVSLRGQSTQRNGQVLTCDRFQGPRVGCP